MGKEFAAQGKKVITLDDSGCLCTTMFRISPQHLCWVLENLVEGNIVNQIQGQRRSEDLGARGPRSHAGDRLEEQPGSTPERRVGRIWLNPARRALRSHAGAGREVAVK
jgi:hypothetical protein